MPSSPPRMLWSSRLLLDQGARLFNADERLLCQETERMRIPGKRICSRQTDDARTKLAAGSERTMESACADHHKCVGSKATAGGNARLVAWRRLTCVVSEIAGHTRAHAEARGDLHGRRHLHSRYGHVMARTPGSAVALPSQSRRLCLHSGRLAPVCVQNVGNSARCSARRR
jgi:hypothetical protein